MPTDLPLSRAQVRLISHHVERECGRAAAVLDIRLPVIPFRLDLSGTVAGMFCVRGQQRWLRFNPWLFANDFALHARDTVTHEVAHYGVYTVFGHQRRIKPHGSEWRSLMVALGADPKATFRANMDGVPVRRQSRHAYRCACQQHWVSATRHNRMAGGRAEYRCRVCHERLSPDRSSVP